MELDLFIKSNEDLIKHWHKRIRESQFSHYESEKFYSKMNLFIGIPATIFPIITGSTIFASLPLNSNLYIKVIWGTTSLITASLIGLQTILKLSQRAEKHKTIASRYGAIRRELEELTSTTQGKLSDKDIKLIRVKIDALSEDAPNVSTRIWNRTKRILKEENKR